MAEQVQYQEGQIVSKTLAQNSRHSLTLAEHEKYMKPESILEMDEDTYKSILNRRFWYTGEDAHWFWKCNALRSMVNSGDEKYHKLIKQYSNHEDERISGVALWGRRKLGI